MTDGGGDNKTTFVIPANAGIDRIGETGWFPAFDIQATPHGAHGRKREAGESASGVRGGMDSLFAWRSHAMIVSMRIRSLNHSVYQHQYHIVWGTKYRRHILKPQHIKREFLWCIKQIIEKEPTLQLLSINTDLDHAHLQIEIPPSIAVAVVVQILKAKTSIHLKKKFKFIREVYIDGNVWSVGYFSSTIGLNEDQIKKYIEYQGKQDLPKQPRLGFSWQKKGNPGL
jgi:putative transposase